MADNQGLVIGLDPGESIGVAVLLIDLPRHPQVVYAGEVKNQFEVIPRVIASIKTYSSAPVEAVVIEDFIGSGRRDASIVHTLKALGFLEGWYTLRGWTVVLQVPQLRKAFLQDAWQLAGYEASEHGVDALAHTLSYAWHHHYRAVTDTRLGGEPWLDRS